MIGRKQLGAGGQVKEPTLNASAYSRSQPWLELIVSGEFSGSHLITTELRPKFLEISHPQGASLLAFWL